MAKKRKNPFEGSLRDNAFPGAAEMPLSGLPEQELLELAPLVAGLTDQDGMLIFSMLGELIESGVTPEKYAAFYTVYQKLRPMMMEGSHNTRKKTDGAHKPREAGDTTLLLKIQMKGMTKPPMWREVEIDGGRSFLDLHNVIQTVMGFENCHLWQFNEKAYDNMVRIGITSTSPYHPGLEYVTDEADSTPIDAYLSKVGDKLEYVYDFGDDWTFTVSVKKLLAQKLQHPVCTAFKSDLNPVEDSGGIWAYDEMRWALEHWDNISLNEKNDIAERAGFEDLEYYYNVVKGNIFNIDAVNEKLKSI